MTSSASPSPSSHPIDVLIRQLVSTGRTPTPIEKQQIVQHVAIAPFRPARVRLDPNLRGKVLQGHTFNSSRESSLLAHWGKRILVDEEWSVTTTPAQYEQDLRDAVTNTGAIHFAHTLTQGVQVGSISDNNLPDSRKGPLSKPYIYVVYSSEHGCLLTGYQALLTTINHGGDLLWL